MKFDERKIDLIQELPVMNGIPIEQQESMIYLGLPLGSNSFISYFFDKIMSKSERAFYSLNGLGCQPYALNPRIIAFIYYSLFYYYKFPYDTINFIIDFYILNRQ